MKLRAYLAHSTISIIALTLITLSHIKLIPNPVLIEFENVLYDIRLRATMPNTQNTDIVIIDIDEKSLSEQGHWPWQRDKLANLVNSLFDHYQLDSLGFDMVFAEPQPSTAISLIEQLSQAEPNINFEQYREKFNFDYHFAESIFARNIVLGYVFKQTHNQSTTLQVGQLPMPISAQSILGDAAEKLYLPVGYTANIADLQFATDYGGFFDYVRDDDTLRKVPLLQNYQANLYPALALQLAATSLNQPYQFILSADKKVIETIKIGNIHIPVDETASMYVPFRGTMGSFHYLSATDIINQRLPLNILKNKIGIVGTSAAGLLDLRATPVGESYAGVEVHANTLAGILEQRVKTKPDYALGLEVLQLLVLAILMAFIYPRLSPRNSLLFLISIAASIIAINMYFWLYQAFIFELAAALSLLALSSFFHTSYNFFIEQKNKRQLSKVFGQYIPSQVVDSFDLDEAQMTLSGESRVMTVFFADVRNFTNISEKMAPADLTKMMNAFLTPVTKQIHLARGTIDKYMGDAVMAFWGAPVKDAEHANHAVSASFAILKAIETVNHDFVKSGWPKIALGIGLSSGEMNVGNMGSEFRVAYTVMGDAVNLGSRLEGLTKVYGQAILVSEQTQRLDTQHHFLTIDKVRVKGKQQPITIYAPVMEITTQHQLVEAALTAYWQGNFDNALAKLEQITTPDLATLKQLYLVRCEQFKTTPPPLDWDGVFDHKTK